MVCGLKIEGHLDLVVSTSSLLVFSAIWNWSVVINQSFSSK